MKTGQRILMLAPVLGCLIVGANAYAQASCTKKMFNQPTSASDQCLSDQVDALKSKIEKRYADMGSKLPDTATSTSGGDSMSKARLSEVHDLWKSYQNKACLMDAARYDLQPRYENRMYSICWIAGAKQHLALLR
jgi:hypothetical protein